MKKLVTVTAVTLLCGSAFAQNTGPTPQTGMEKPGTTKRRQARWFDGHHRHERNQGQYKKRQGRCAGPEGRKEVSRSLTRRAHQAICR